MKITALTLILVSLAAPRTFAASRIQVSQLLKSVEEKTAPPNESVQLKMIIQEADGSKKERVIRILRRNGQESRALIRLLEPADLKGLALLTVSNGNKEDQWLYLPSDKKSRRILGANSKGRFLDSEIAYEDLKISTYKEFRNRVLKQDRKMIEIDSEAKPGADSSYGRIVTWISRPDDRILRVDYYDKSHKLLKRADFKNYQKIGNKYWRARIVLVQNVQNKRKTELVMQKLSLKPISKSDVSLSALEE